MRVKRVQADMLGVNFDYDSWSTRTLFVRVQTAGYPLTRIEQFVGRVPATEEDLELYGLRERTIESNMIQNIEAARNLARSVKSFKDHEPSSFAVEVLVDFGVYIDMLINVQEGFSGVDDLFDVVQATHGLNGKSPSTTRLQLEEVDLS